MAKRRISEDLGLAAVKSCLDNPTPHAESLAIAVRFLLDQFALRLPGNSVEIRIPPIAAIQCLEGPKHSRGTPPNVVEMAPETWLKLATGITNWEQALQMNQISTSGARADLSSFLPIQDFKK